MGNMISNWVLMSAVARDELGTPRFIFTDHPHCLRFELDGCPGTVPQIRKLIAWAFKEAHDCLTNKLLFGIPIVEFGIPPGMIIDNPNNTEPGYSFLTDERNVFVKRPGLLLCKVFGSSKPDIANYFGHVVGNEIIWNIGNCRLYLDHGQRFLELLITANEFTHGQPTRGSEVLSTTYVNLPNLPRSLIFSGGQVINALRVNKTDSTTGHTQLIPHFMPSEAYTLHYYYIALCRELEQELAWRAYGPIISKSYQAYMYTGPSGRWNVPRLTMILKQGTSKFLGDDSAFGVSLLRQLLIPIYHHHCSSKYRADELKDEDAREADELGDFQSGHSSQTARIHYGVEHRTHGHISEIKWRALQQVMFCFDNWVSSDIGTHSTLKVSTTFGKLGIGSNAARTM